MDECRGNSATGEGNQKQAGAASSHNSVTTVTEKVVAPDDRCSIDLGTMT